MKCKFVFVLIALMLILTGCGGSSKESSDTQPPAAEVSDQTPSVDFATADLTPENVKAAISDQTIRDRVTDVTIADGVVTVVVYSKDIWSAESFLKSNQYDSGKVFEDLFKNSNVTTVIYQSDVDVQDAYGGTTRATAQTNTMLREDADKVQDWGNFAYESPEMFYSVVNYELASESEIGGIHEAWANMYSE